MPLTDQRIRNLERAHDVRKLRAELKRQVKAGEVKVSSSLSIPTLPSYLVGLEVGKFLALIRGVSYKKAVALCEELRVNALNPLGKLTYRQRRVIAAHVESRWEAKQEVEGSGRGAIEHKRARFRTILRAAP